MPTYRTQLPDTIVTLLGKRDTQGLRAFLRTCVDNKGKVFELLLAELYEGNGWHVALKGGRGDAGADILLFHPNTPSTVSLIIQAKNRALPLNFDQTKIELMKFEEQGASLYNCQNFRLVSVSGFVRRTKKLTAFNMLLGGWEHVEELVSTYAPQSELLPKIELYAHNRNTYERINELWTASRHVAVVQATGTGKGYLIAKVLADHIDKPKVVLAPSTYILDEQKSKIPWLSSSTGYLTYKRLLRMKAKEIAILDYSLIVLDEFHRCGAKEWSKGVQKLLDCHPEAKVLGTTATPIRYLDNSRDMVEELFEGVIAENLSLASAIVRRILPPPTYISALYTLNDECTVLRDAVSKSRHTKDEKAELVRKINSVQIEWQKTSGVPQILKKYLPPSINKLIVFCKDEQHLDEMEVEVQRWFQKAGTHKRRKTYRVLASDPDSDRELADFRKADRKDTAHLLFAVEKLNEGLHIPEVGAVILLRPTESPILFYQQIGRCMQVGMDHSPIIFDLVNNFRSIRASDFLADLAEAKGAEARRRAEVGLSEYAPSVIVEDVSKPIREVIEEIGKQLVSWEVMYEVFAEYVRTQGNAKVPSNATVDGYQLGIWVVKQRASRGCISQERRERLEALPGWSWDPFSDQWEEGFCILKEYVEEKGHARVPQSHKTTGGFKLGVWVNSQRTKRKKLTTDRIQRLEELPGWCWNARSYRWEEGFSYLQQYVRREGHARVPTSHKESNFNLGGWANQQRSRKNRLTNERRQRLEALPGWTWESRSFQWEDGFSHLEQYVEVKGDAKVPQSHKSDDGFSLGLWVTTQRRNKRNLSEEQIQRLQLLPGWSWNTRSSKWEEGVSRLIAYVDEKGDANVPQSYITADGFSLGNWVTTQRCNRETMSRQRKERLEALPGWSWNAVVDQWTSGFSHLLEFVRRKGHARVPSGYKAADGFNLGAWIRTQRANEEKMPLDRRELLERLPGWCWNSRSYKWEEGFSHLKKFVEEFGHAKVSQTATGAGGFKLGAWVNNQRTRKNTLSQDRIERLEALPGWCWDTLIDQWDEGFRHLQEYVSREHHAKVPKTHIEAGFRLGAWVAWQRSSKKKLSPERVKRLESVPGWIWNVRSDQWEEGFRHLEEYLKNEGHSRVPQSHKSTDGFKLGSWVSVQRGNREKMSQQRRNRLEALRGWEWRIGS
ncbi:Helicase associated domain protein [Geomonas subterranea]|uniref:Helicase associated domain protein n=1 Tax=Geomonas subterranea TaxID=2847989 RepID=A0ABX8LLN9_9BACT|nr:Helicase associated domain protein [Geomonas subterranea]QXE92797.1 Helicase associated domain protein [Geomonas subterranea]QXM09100.1 Helicase associated domain protein [Geomonas subterranea]